MDEFYVNTYLSYLESDSHSRINSILSIDIENFCVLSGVLSIQRNIEKLELIETGGILFTQDPVFLNNFKSAIRNNIQQERLFYSDIFKSNFTLIVYRQSPDSFKFIYEISPTFILEVINNRR
jgi:hypothetical protein